MSSKQNCSERPRRDGSEAYWVRRSISESEGMVLSKICTRSTVSTPKSRFHMACLISAKGLRSLFATIAVVAMMSWAGES
jgi:hypothetical protein